MLIPNNKLDTMELLYPKRKPVGKVKIDWSHPLAKNASDLILFDGKHSAPFDEVSKSTFTADTTHGALEYKYQPINGSLAFARQDLDESGISYHGEATGVDEKVNPVFIFMIYTILAAPSGSSKAIFQREGIAVGSRSGNPGILITSQSTTMLHFYTNSAYLFTNIPVNVGERHIMAYRYDGVNQHQLYDSAKGVWEKVTSAGNNKATTGDVNWLGTGYTAELPVAFELFIAGSGKSPTQEALNATIQDPYQFLIPA